jgi:anti-sigma regulatory factor (Ser/Thr protein kinase)
MPEPTDYATPGGHAFTAAASLLLRLASDGVNASPAVGPGESLIRAVLKPEPTAAAQARRLTRAALASWRLSHLADEAETIASELATNAFSAAVPPLATRPAIIFAVHRGPEELRIVVWDDGPGQPLAAEPGPDAENGRGLAIVGDLTGRNWGWQPTPYTGGKVVWAVLRINPGHSTANPVWTGAPSRFLRSPRKGNEEQNDRSSDRTQHVRNPRDPHIP